MSDSPAPASQPTPVAAPQNIYVSQFSAAMNAAELLVCLGHTRLIPEMNPSGVTAHPQVEWLATLAMSPTAGKQLLIGLKSIVESYEEVFGQITMQPDFKVETKI